jgi:hypothetical protein
MGVILTALLIALRRVLAVATGRVDGGPPLLDPSWIIRRGSGDVAVVTLADGGSKISRFKSASLKDKLAYAKLHNYTLIAADRSLDPSRHIEWSKLRLVYRALHAHPVVLWLDVDTLVWNKQISVESFVAKTQRKGLVAQLDLGRDRSSLYWNSGVFVMRDTPAMRSVLEKAYREWHIVLLRGIVYFYCDQDALNRITFAMTAEEFRQNVHLHGYNELWGLPRDTWKDGSAPWILHSPNCLGDCPSMFLEYYKNMTSREKGAAT